MSAVSGPHRDVSGNDAALLVRRLLAEARVSCAEVARRLHIATSAVSQWQTGKRHCRVETLDRIARVCGYRMEIRFVRATEVARDVHGLRDTDQPALNEVWHDAFGRPWVRTVEGWAPAPGNELRVRLSWSTLIGLYGRTRVPADDVEPRRR